MIFSIVTALLEASAIVAVALWLLHRWGINIPIWGLSLVIAAFGAYQVITYHMGKKALDRRPEVSPEAIVGCCGRAATRLAPNGYVRVEGELWQASAIDAEIAEDEDVVVVGIKRLTLFVKLNSNHQRELIQPGESIHDQVKREKEIRRRGNDGDRMVIL